MYGPHKQQAIRFSDLKQCDDIADRFYEILQKIMQNEDMSPEEIRAYVPKRDTEFKYMPSMPLSFLDEWFSPKYHIPYLAFQNNTLTSSYLPWKVYLSPGGNGDIIHLVLIELPDSLGVIEWLIIAQHPQITEIAAE